VGTGGIQNWGSWSQSLVKAVSTACNAVRPFPRAAASTALGRAAWWLASGGRAASPLPARFPAQMGLSRSLVGLALGTRSAELRASFQVPPAPRRGTLPAPPRQLCRGRRPPHLCRCPRQRAARRCSGQHVRYSLFLFLGWCPLSSDLSNKATRGVFAGGERRSSSPPRRARRPTPAPGPAERAGTAVPMVL